MKYYIEARRADDSRVLGNCDGQAVLHARNPTRCNAWKRLLGDQKGVALDGKVARWVIVTESGGEVASVANRHNPPA